MTMCTKCLRVRFLRLRYKGRTEEYVAGLKVVITRIRRFIDRGVLIIVQGQEGLGRLLQDPGSDDIHVIALRCVNCKREFLLIIGRGAVEVR